MTDKGSAQDYIDQLVSKGWMEWVERDALGGDVYMMTALGVKEMGLNYPVQIVTGEIVNGD